jgi:hypothetical protein
VIFNLPSSTFAHVKSVLSTSGASKPLKPSQPPCLAVSHTGIVWLVGKDGVLLILIGVGSRIYLPKVRRRLLPSSRVRMAG